MQVTMPTLESSLRHLQDLVGGPDNSRPISFTSGSFSDTQQRCSATEKEAFPAYHSLSKGMKISKLDQWPKELAGYNITFVHERVSITS